MAATRKLYKELARDLGVHDAPAQLVTAICTSLADDNPRFSGTMFREAVDSYRPACDNCGHTEGEHTKEAGRTVAASVRVTTCPQFMVR
jgi:uncharacterized protein (DUF983 family)